TTLPPPRSPHHPSTTLFRSRRAIDAMLYVAMLAVLAIGLIMPGQQTGAAYSDAGLLPAWPFITYIAVQLILGLRDKVTFLASRRSEEHTSELQSRFDVVCRL